MGLLSEIFQNPPPVCSPLIFPPLPPLLPFLSLFSLPDDCSAPLRTPALLHFELQLCPLSLKSLPPLLFSQIPPLPDDCSALGSRSSSSSSNQFRGSVACSSSGNEKQMEGEADGSESAADVSALRKNHLAMLERLSNHHQSRPDKSDSPPPPSNPPRPSFPSSTSPGGPSSPTSLSAGSPTSPCSSSISTRSPPPSPTSRRSSRRAPTTWPPSQALDNLSSELTPKKKFSFKNKPARKERTAPSSKGAEAEN